MRISLRKLCGLVAAMLSFAALGFLIHGLHANAAQPSSQSELDRLRNDAPNEWLFLEIKARNDAYYAEATGVSYTRAECGTSVENLVLLRLHDTFSGTVIIVLSEDDALRRVEHASQLPLAYLPAHGGPARNGDPLVFNYKVRDAVIRKRQSHMPRLAAREAWSWIDYSGLLQLPATRPANLAVDGSGVDIAICRNGLHYRFQRSLNGNTLEPQLQSLIAMLERHAPDIADGP